MIRTIPQNHVDPHSKGFNPTTHCKYCFDALGHGIEDCRFSKSKVENMTQTKIIVVENE